MLSSLSDKTIVKSKRIKYDFAAQPWKYSGPGGWHFISLPKKLAKEMRDVLKPEEEGWGRLKVIAKIGNSEWQTAVWFDTRLNTTSIKSRNPGKRKSYYW